jgi:hypothetical protein
VINFIINRLAYGDKKEGIVPEFQKSVESFEYDFGFKLSEIPLPDKLKEMYELLVEDFSETQESANCIFYTLATMHFLYTGIFNLNNGIKDNFNYSKITPIYEASFLWEKLANDKQLLDEALFKFRKGIPLMFTKLNIKI